LGEFDPTSPSDAREKLLELVDEQQPFSALGKVFGGIVDLLVKKPLLLPATFRQSLDSAGVSQRRSQGVRE
jgi:hypothetical protein